MATSTLPDWTVQEASRIGIDVAAIVLGFVMLVAVALLTFALLREITR